MLRFSSIMVGAFALALGTASAAHAAPITFVATGNANVVGSVTFDDSIFDGSAAQGILNSNILALSLTVFGVTFGLDDVVDGDTTFINSSGPVPSIHNGGGDLAVRATGQRILFFPDDNAPGVPDGDASLAFDAGSDADTIFLAVRWVVDGVTDVPEPATLTLLGAGLAGLGWARRRRPI